MGNSLKPAVVHLVTPYLFPTGSWVYSQLTGLHSFRSVVFTQKKEMLDQFPFGEIYSPEDFSIGKRYLNRIYRRVFDAYGLFFDSTVRELQPRLFHAHFGFEGVRWLNLVQRNGLPLVTTFYGQDVSSLGKIVSWQKRYAKLFKYGTTFLAEGTFLKRQLTEIGCPEEKVVVQHLGVDLARYHQKRRSFHEKAKSTIILQVSSFREKKGIEYSLEAIALIRKAGLDVQFRLIGCGDNLETNEKVFSLVRRLNLGDCVVLLGAKGHGETIREMGEADIFLHPSVTAQDGDNEGGAPVGIIEASAVGIAVVSTLHADIPEVVQDGVSGYLVPERNAGLLAEKLAQLIEAPGRRLLFGDAGREHIAKNYNLEIQLQKLENIYTKCLQQSV